MMHKRSLIGAAAATILFFAELPASAQAPDAQERCEPDVMRYCSEFNPDRDRIVECLKRKRDRLSRSCLSALQARAQSTRKHRSGR
jgi:hypothetical protein